MSKVIIKAEDPNKYSNFQKICKEMLDDLYLQDWSIEIIASNDEMSRDGSAAHININHVYKFAELTIYQQLFTKEKEHPGAIYEAIRHEFIHCILERMLYAAKNRFVTEDELKQAAESTTQHITRILTWKFNSKKYGKNINYYPSDKTKEHSKAKKTDKTKRGSSRKGVRSTNKGRQDKNRSTKNGKGIGKAKPRRDGDVHR